jgi:hypothetical protein
MILGTLLVEMASGELLEEMTWGGTISEEQLVLGEKMTSEAETISVRKMILDPEVMNSAGKMILDPEVMNSAGKMILDPEVMNSAGKMILGQEVKKAA